MGNVMETANVDDTYCSSYMHILLISITVMSSRATSPSTDTVTVYFCAESGTMCSSYTYSLCHHQLQKPVSRTRYGRGAMFTHWKCMKWSRQVASCLSGGLFVWHTKIANNFVTFLTHLNK